MNPKRFLENFDFPLLGIVFMLIGIGWLSIYSGSGEVPYHWKQLIWLGLGIPIMALSILVPYRKILDFSPVLYLACTGLLIYTLFQGFGNRASDVSRWVNIAGFNIQASEFMKLALALLLAKYYSEERRIRDIGFIRIAVPLSLILIPFFLVLKQPDLGTAFIIFAVGFPMIYYAGLRNKVLLAGLLSALIIAPAAWFYILKPYQKKRILTLLNPDMDPLGAGYHIIQSKIAIGSGEIFGKGFLEGSQTQLNFLPARHTDFIFSVFSEEWGFIGGILVLTLYFLLVWRCLSFLGKDKSRSASMLSLGIASLFFFQIAINLGMSMGVMPVVGMPLPFMSYGGSSLLVSLIAAGLMINVRLRRGEHPS